MAILLVLHSRLSSAMLLFALVCAVWGVWAYGCKQAVSGSYWGTLIIGELLVIAQGLVGVALLIAGQPPDRAVHVLYGVLAAFTWPAAFYTRGHTQRREGLTYGLASFLVVAFAIRATMTA